MVILLGLYVFLRLVFDSLVSQGRPGFSGAGVVPVVPLALSMSATTLVLGAYIATNPVRLKGFLASLRAFLIGDSSYSLGLPIPRVLLLMILPLVVFLSVPETQDQVLTSPAQYLSDSSVMAESVHDSVWRTVQASNVLLFLRGQPQTKPMQTKLQIQRSKDRLALRWVLGLSDLERAGIIDLTRSQEAHEAQQSQEWNAELWCPEVWFSSQELLGYRPSFPKALRNTNQSEVWDGFHPGCRVAFDGLRVLIYWRGQIPELLSENIEEGLIAVRVVRPKLGATTGLQAFEGELSSLWLSGGLHKVFQGWPSKTPLTLGILYLIEIIAMVLAAGAAQNLAGKAF